MLRTVFLGCAMADDNATDVFIYTGIGEGAVVPSDAVRVRIDPSVLVISEHAFSGRSKMETIELHDGLREIGHDAFSYCRSLKEVQSSGGVERIGSYAFYSCTRFTKFRIPPLVATIPYLMLNGCTGLFSLEVSAIIIQVEQNAFGSCYSLRNIALASNTVVVDYAFLYCYDLLHIFGSEEAIVNALRNRFDGLPVHSKMYYIPYYPMSLEEIRNIFMSENGELHPSGLQQDCLGMTPLHILACSTVQWFELYQLIVDNFPGNLIVEDAWGATPLLYAVWGDAPSEIVKFLVNSYQSLYPNHDFDWNDMVITLGKASASKGVIQNLIDVQQSLSSEYNIDWDQVLGMLAEETEYKMSPKTFCFLTRCSIATRVNAIGVKHFRDATTDDWMGDDNDFNREEWRTETLTKLEYYESEYGRLKEVTSLLELALWKLRMDDDSKAGGRGNKKIKIDLLEFRLQCRVSCGADHVVENIWPYSLPPDFVRSYVYSDEEENEDEIEDVDDNTGEEDNDDDDVDDDDNVEEVDEEVEKDEWRG
jgi:hypothetical protein